MQEMIYAVYGEGAGTDRICRKWFAVSLGTINFGQMILCSEAVLCIGRCLAAPLASTH